MKSTGIVRQLDSQGRFVLPSELKKNMDIKPYDSMEVFVEDEKIILQKYKSKNACIICGEETKDKFEGKNICKECMEKLVYRVLEG